MTPLAFFKASGFLKCAMYSASSKSPDSFSSTSTANWPAQGRSMRNNVFLSAPSENVAVRRSYSTPPFRLVWYEVKPGKYSSSLASSGGWFIEEGVLLPPTPLDVVVVAIIIIIRSFSSFSFFNSSCAKIASRKLIVGFLHAVVRNTSTRRFGSLP